MNPSDIIQNTCTQMNITAVDVLIQDYLKPLGLHGFNETLANATGISQRKLNLFLMREHDMDMEIATGLATYFGTSHDLWLNLGGM